MDKTDSVMKQVANVTEEEFAQIRERNQIRHQSENAKSIQVANAVNSMLKNGRARNVVKPSHRVTIEDVK